MLDNEGHVAVTCVTLRSTTGNLYSPEAAVSSQPSSSRASVMSSDRDRMTEIGFLGAGIMHTIHTRGVEDKEAFPRSQSPDFLRRAKCD